MESVFVSRKLRDSESSEAACNEVELVDGLGMQVMLVNSSRPQNLMWHRRLQLLHVRTCKRGRLRDDCHWTTNRSAHLQCFGD